MIWAVFLFVGVVLWLLWKFSQPETIQNTPRTWGSNWVVVNDWTENLCLDGQLFKSQKAATRAAVKLKKNALFAFPVSVRYTSWVKEDEMD